MVTALAPAYCEFNQATSTIYWIDAQWVFPQPAIVELGRPHTLTTTLMRRTDGMPLAGWIVRYDVSGGASLGYEGGNFVEATTDAAGRASVEVSPKDAGGGVINVGITIIRPQTAGPAVDAATGTRARGDDDHLDRRGAAAGGADRSRRARRAVPLRPAGNFSPPPSLPPVTNPAGPPPATAPPAALAPNPNTPPAAATGKPRLEASIGPRELDQVAVGEFASFELTVTNRGDGVARNIFVTDRFDRGLRHEQAQAQRVRDQISVWHARTCSRTNRKRFG